MVNIFRWTGIVLARDQHSARKRMSLLEYVEAEANYIQVDNRSSRSSPSQIRSISLSEFPKVNFWAQQNRCRTGRTPEEKKLKLLPSDLTSCCHWTSPPITNLFLPLCCRKEEERTPETAMPKFETELS
ncbi:unnamed protein product [Cuscuta epithymum]|uniref:Homeobox domain-containing protein n=1 Tax=Cuscuta epithymum TaxID=186058 RepID=A0AAV0DUR0_9ASTE|nr:unnamed protein product [Cuscuta epithymum]